MVGIWDGTGEGAGHPRRGCKCVKRTKPAIIPMAFRSAAPTPSLATTHKFSFRTCNPALVAAFHKDANGLLDFENKLS